MIETIRHHLPQSITLDCRACGAPGKPLLLFVHGFPEGAFIWDGVMTPFSDRWRCVAPDLRGYGHSSQPADVAAYRPKTLVQDLVELIARESPGQPAACVIAHDWGGALAWNLAIQHPQLLKQLLIINAPHPGTFLRELQHNPAQQAASQYMHFLRRPDAAEKLLADGARRLWAFFRTPAGALPDWLTPELQARYLAHWQQSLATACHYYSASPLVPPREADHSIQQLQLPDSLLSTPVPTQVLWGMDDVALRPELLNGLEQWVPHLTVEPVPGASHWLVHEQPAVVIRSLHQLLLSALTHRTAPAPTQSASAADLPLDY
ncbi:alpha/beta fold hydrolase [Comamonas sp. UBA7528]|uniref:alpha/beta fold hydrolase n=1 Tax=Comamonas sp. UBA7528 TaxID=1946391 RepID=UPI0025B9C380|nr:alpha/beta fold hydrolase [Comamonas sp. UBA7528]